MKKLFLLFVLIPLFCISCSGEKEAPGKKIMVTCINKPVTSLDPALAADTVSQYMTAAFYDTPLQYSFTRRPYTLEPAMLEKLPEYSRDGKTLTCRLRKDLLFQKNPCFPDENSRKIRAEDFVFSILRLADPRVRSSGFWLIRGKIAGLEEWRRNASQYPAGDLTPYDRPCSGLRIVDGHTFEIRLTSPDPRFGNVLAMPYLSVVSRRAVACWKEAFADHPAGSGPFILKEWQKDHGLTLIRNPDFREEYFGKERLPLLDGIRCFMIRQPVAGWLMFLQGELDSFVLNNDDFVSVVKPDGTLSRALQNRGIELIRSPEPEINYIGFNFLDPVLGKNVFLRRAVSLAFDKGKRVRQTGGRLTEATGPVPPGMTGYLASPGPYGKKDLKKARLLMKEAGYPGGIDPKTGKPLVLTFDQAGSGTFYRQTAELLALDLREIGIELKPEFQSRPMFLQKVRRGQTQLFRLSWTGDYPDAENFLQLFYSPNGGSGNRTFCSIPAFDREYRKILPMGDSPERDRAYVRLAELVQSECPWIFESYTVSFLLKHRWMKNFIPHDFAFNRWKYHSVDPEMRKTMKGAFTPLSFEDLRK